MYQSPCPFLRVDDCFTVKKKSKKKGKIPMSLYIGIIIVISYLLVCIRLTNGIIKYNTTNNQSFLPEVSIIISAHNEENNIANLLESLINQTYPSNYEIIIANDRSNDSTKQIILDYANDYDYIKLIDITETPISWGNKKWALDQLTKRE